MANILIKNSEGLIGDFLGTIPVMQEFSNGNRVVVDIRSQIRELFHLIHPKYNLIAAYNDYEYHAHTYKRIELHSTPAFEFSERRSLYMTDTYLNMHGFNVKPQHPAKADLVIPHVELPVHLPDYVIAPYSRSLPDDQRWPIDKWKELVAANPHKEFAVIGTEKQDDSSQWNLNNCFPFFDHSWVEVATLLRNSKHGLISVVSGPSHFAFHLGIPKYLICNQKGAWGRNPDAILINDHIPDLTVEKVLSYL